MDAAHYLGVYDTKLIYSWTPREFKNFIKGARLSTVDEYEKAAATALWTASAQNSKKRIKLKDLYDAEKARNEIESGSKPKKVHDLTLYRKAQAAMKAYHPKQLEKGG